MKAPLLPTRLTRYPLRSPATTSVACHLCGLSTSPRRQQTVTHRDLRAGYILELGGEAEGTLPWEDKTNHREPTWKTLERESVEALAEKEGIGSLSSYSAAPKKGLKPLQRVEEPSLD